MVRRSLMIKKASILVFTFTLFSAWAVAQDFLPELVKRVKPSAVAIETFDAKGNSISRGSGFFISENRVITNRHVIERSSRVVIHLIDGKKFVAKGVLDGDQRRFIDSIKNYEDGKMLAYYETADELKELIERGSGLNQSYTGQSKPVAPGSHASPYAQGRSIGERPPVR